MDEVWARYAVSVLVSRKQVRPSSPTSRFPHLPANLLMLLVSCVNTPIWKNVLVHCLGGACGKVLRVLRERGLNVTGYISVEFTRAQLGSG